jgi:DNA-binding transcriptional ArsR family regulator
MGATKTEGFTKVHLDLAAIAKALAHPARIAILHHLAAKRECMCGDIVDELPLSQSTVSQHLSELKSAGLIKGTIEGPGVCYCINEPVWKKAREAMQSFFASPKTCF